MKENELPLEKLNYIAKQLPKFTSPVHLQSALRLYEQGATSEVEVIRRSSIEAKVHAYSVKINLDFLPYSSCGCGYKGICEHIAAAFMAVYLTVESKDKLFGSGKEEKRVLPSIEASKKTSAKPSDVRPAPASKPAASLPRSTDRPEQWLNYFGQIFKQHQDARHYTIPTLYEKIMRNLIDPARVWHPGKREMYMILAVLFTLGKLEQAFWEDRSRNYNREDYDRTFGMLYSSLFSTSSDVPLDESISPYLESIQGLLISNQMIKQNSPIDWLMVYCRLWWTVLKEPSQLKKEKQRIQAVIHNSVISAEAKKFYTRLLGHLEVIAGDDKRARDRLASFIRQHPIDGSIILYQLGHEQQWERLQEWLKWYPIDHFLDDEYERDTFFRYCALVGIHQGAMAGGAVSLLKKYLPFSFEFYADYLMQSNQHKAWMDLHMWAGFDPSLMDREDIKKMEQIDPRLLLPMYHQSVEDYIALKNRSGYREAVKLLRKLRSFYKMLKETSQWEKYMQRLLAQHRRLRAFCEELEKGNVMP